MKLALGFAVLAMASASAQQPLTTVANRAFNGAQGNSYDCCGSLSPDGRYLVFGSASSNLVRGDHNGMEDVFLTDRWTGQIERINLSSTGAETHGFSNPGSVSADGRWVFFSSTADDLAPGGMPGMYDCFLRDRQLGTTVVVPPSHDGQPLDGESGVMAMTPDARWFLFVSSASNLLPTPPPPFAQLYLWDRQTGTTRIVSLSNNGNPASGTVFWSTITPDGRYVAFETESSMEDPSDTNGEVDVYFRDLLLGTTTLVSRNAAGFSNGGYWPSIADDGSWVGYNGGEDGVVPDDNNNCGDIYQRNLATGTVVLVNRAWNGSVPETDSNGVITGDGKYAIFQSDASNILPGDLGYCDVFRRNLQTGVIERVSVSNTGQQGAGVNELGAINADGSVILMRSDATNLVVPDYSISPYKLFLRDFNGLVPPAMAYCIPGTNSTGCTGVLAGIGQADANAATGFNLAASGIRGQSIAIVHYGVSGPYIVPFASSDSVRCIRPPLQRTRIISTGGTAGACDGQAIMDWNEFIAANPQALGNPFLGGEAIWAQAWVRDPGSLVGGVFTNAVWFTVAP